jgi:hypothetical protein
VNDGTSNASRESPSREVGVADTVIAAVAGSLVVALLREAGVGSWVVIFGVAAIVGATLALAVRVGRRGVNRRRSSN